MLKEFGDMLDGKGPGPVSTWAARLFLLWLTVMLFCIGVLMIDLVKDVWLGGDEDVLRQILDILDERLPPPR